MNQSKIAQAYVAVARSMSFGMCFYFIIGTPINNHISFTGEAGEVESRLLPCCCPFCLSEDYTHCLNHTYVGSFSSQTLHALGLRTTTARYSKTSNSTAGYIPKAIVGSRIFRGKYQYEIQWEGYDDTTWNDADSLEFEDLVEEYEGIL